MLGLWALFFLFLHHPLLSTFPFVYAHEVSVCSLGRTHVEARAGQHESAATSSRLTVPRQSLLLRPVLVTSSKLGDQEAPGILMSPLRSAGVTQAHLEFYVGCWGT